MQTRGFAGVSTLACRYNKRAECSSTHRCWAQAVVESTPPRPGHALHRGPVNSHYSMTSELTPLYNQRTRTTLQPENSQHSTTNKLTPHLLNLEGASCRGKGKSVAIKLRNMKVSWFTDNQNVLRILKVGSCKPHLQIEP